MFSKFFSSISKKWLIAIISLILILSVSSVYYYNEFYRQDRISVEVLNGDATKNKQTPIRGNGVKLTPGDSIKVSETGTTALIFHDGSVLSFKNGDEIKYNGFESIDQKNIFGFRNLKTDENFEYITQAYLSKAGAVILGREDGASELSDEAKSKVLGANERKLNDTEKEVLWKNINICMQSPKEGETFSFTLQRCLEINNISTISILEL